MAVASGWRIIKLHLIRQFIRLHSMLATSRTARETLTTGCQDSLASRTLLGVLRLAAALWIQSSRPSSRLICLLQIVVVNFANLASWSQGSYSTCDWPHPFRQLVEPCRVLPSFPGENPVDPSSNHSDVQPVALDCC